MWVPQATAMGQPGNRVALLLLLACCMQQIVCYDPLIAYIGINNVLVTGSIIMEVYCNTSCQTEIINSYTSYHRNKAHYLLHTAGQQQSDRRPGGQIAFSSVYLL